MATGAVVVPNSAAGRIAGARCSLPAGGRTRGHGRNNQATKPNGGTGQHIASSSHNMTTPSSISSRFVGTQAERQVGPAQPGGDIYTLIPAHGRRGLPSDRGPRLLFPDETSYQHARRAAPLPPEPALHSNSDTFEQQDSRQPWPNLQQQQRSSPGTAPPAPGRELHRSLWTGSSTSQKAARVAKIFHRLESPSSSTRPQIITTAADGRKQHQPACSINIKGAKMRS